MKKIILTNLFLCLNIVINAQISGEISITPPTELIYSENYSFTIGARLNYNFRKNLSYISELAYGKEYQDFTGGIRPGFGTFLDYHKSDFLLFNNYFKLRFYKTKNQKFSFYSLIGIGFAFTFKDEYIMDYKEEILFDNFRLCNYLALFSLGTNFKLNNKIYFNIEPCLRIPFPQDNFVNHFKEVGRKAGINIGVSYKFDKKTNKN